MEQRTFLASAAEDARALLGAAATNWTRPVPYCPEWDSADLVRHTGGILVWMATIVTTGQRVSRRALEPAPQDAAALPCWYSASLDRAIEVLGAADPEIETWTFSPIGDRRVGWWWRRLAVEVAIHRWDAEQAVTADGGLPPEALNREVAAAGIEEFIVEFLPGLLGAQGVEGLSGTLALHVADVPTEWWIDLDAGGAAVPKRGLADATLRGTGSDLLLWMVNRGSLDAADASGDQEVLAAWSQLRR